MTISLEAWENKLRKKNKKLSNRHIERINQEVKGLTSEDLNLRAKELLSYLDRPLLVMIWFSNEGERHLNDYEMVLLIEDIDGFYYLELKPTNVHVSETMTLMTQQSLYNLAEAANDQRIVLITDYFYSKLGEDFDFENEIGGSITIGNHN